jgi:spermidine/putrescine transport system permease protein
MQQSSPASGKKVLPVGHYRGLGSWTIVFFIFLYLPIVVLIFYSFNANRMVMNWGGFGFEWYLKAFHNQDIQKAVWNSLIVATVSTIFATAIATIGALVLARGGNFRGKTLSLGLITLPLMVPEIVTAVAVLIFFSAIGMNWGLGNVIIAHITFCIPFAFMPIRARLEGMEIGRASCRERV